MIEFTLNGQTVTTDDSPDTPLLWVVRDTFALTGTKFGCGAAQCGACTMHLEGRAVKTCLLPVAAVAGKSITTIEGVGTPELMSALQTAWSEQGVPQCGYCQSGQLMAATSLLANTPNPSAEEIDSAMSGNLCRCGCYPRIKRAIQTVASQTVESPAQGDKPLATEVTL